jgi:hypothetical protein
MSIDHRRLDIRKNGGRPFKLLKKCEGLEQVRARSQHGKVARTTVPAFLNFDFLPWNLKELIQQSQFLGLSANNYKEKKHNFGINSIWLILVEVMQRFFIVFNV